ncbi:hypothetical protein WJ0W_005724 [Paenibacillus melissococcoides]|uniref:Uncharacterized protein n=1 Tax=Paenibacillus melissococcoides TaxID=2912268 RepID=A0ABN8UBH0_9BACL|nr:MULTISPECIES: hypothetical protein [Paenibacillus]MEB9897318.1 hypothetical protein [Bacillus cereus]QVQ56208.1 baseplate assembly protein V [Paenibacillus phage Pd_22F]CAH8247453.1 hypothetical protein WJ0W_004687 [Paenibacillus melissococcoides]CAH8248542.1 hypothetical protein WJ0W_005724 [Paenibacillus melissococcoides]CAH8705099.1 hypothetical protein WDD9_000862 [Paenibacillus melissococcoides]
MNQRTVKIGTVTAVSPEVGAVRVSFFDEDSAVSALLPVIMPPGVTQLPKLKDTVVCVFLSAATNDGFCLGGCYYIQGEQLPSAAPAAVHVAKVSGTAASAPYPDGWKAEDTFILGLRGVVKGQPQELTGYKAVYSSSGIDIEAPPDSTLAAVMLGRAVT